MCASLSSLPLLFGTGTEGTLAVFRRKTLKSRALVIKRELNAIEASAVPLYASPQSYTHPLPLSLFLFLSFT